MREIKDYKKRFYNLLESTIGDIKPLITEEENDGPAIIFPELEPTAKYGFSYLYDYGMVLINSDEGVATVKVSNQGNQPLQIMSAEVSVPFNHITWELPEYPIPVGGTENIKITYNTKRPGPINKRIIFKTNAVNVKDGVISILLKGEVIFQRGKIDSDGNFVNDLPEIEITTKQQTYPENVPNPYDENFPSMKPPY